MKKLLYVLLIINSLAFAEPWKQELQNWKNQRIERLEKPHGWLSLIGMEWFHHDDNTIGSAKDNRIILPHGPSYIGSFNLNGEQITFTANNGVQIKANNEFVDGTIDVAMDSSGSPTVFSIDTFKFHVIERGKPALRIKDSTAKTRKEFKGIEYFPATDKFRLQAEFTPYQPPKELEIINVLGLLNKDEAIGKLKFEIDGNNFQLDVMDAGEDFYLIFADRTSGRTTYGPGRFLYVPKPTQGNMTTIDFNKSYNPPCAFTDYSTCPLPPPQNRIRAFIEAGEKKYQH